jgi:hypothetical protein
MGWHYASEVRPPAGLLFIPLVYKRVDNHGGMISTKETPDSFSRALRQSYQQSILVASGVMHKGNDEFGLAKYFCSHIASNFYVS